jgi:DNA replication licensing factor MCM2
LCVVRDTVDPVEDDLLADFVIGNHQRMHPENQQHQEETSSNVNMAEDSSSNAATVPVLKRDPISGVELIPQPMLRKYIAYARDNIHPHLDINSEKIATLYAQIRTESERTSSVAITVRSVESMIRVTEAHAKLHLRSHVNDDDVNTATRIMLECFISTQKASVMKQMRQVRFN